MFFKISNFLSIIKNKYGNFVIRKAIDRMNFKEKSNVKEFLLKNGIPNGNKDKTKFNEVVESLGERLKVD